MSQEKVELRKQKKGTIKAEQKKANTRELIGKIIIAVLAVAAIVWIGISVFFYAQDKAKNSQKEVNLDAIQEYMEELEEENTEEDDK